MKSAVPLDEPEMEPAARTPAPTAAEMFGAEHVPLPIVPPSPFRPCNPSVHYDGWQWRVSIRAVDYELGQTAPGGSSSKNYLATLDGRLGLDEVSEIADRSGILKYPPAKIRGFEDLRLFTAGGKLCALAVACDLLGGTYRRGGWGRPEICYLTFGASGDIVTARALRGPWSDQPQKNWMPVLDGRGQTALYRTLPPLVVDLATGKATGEIAGFLPASLRGGSQLVWFDGGWLCVCHESTRRPLSYRHRFMWLDSGFAPRKATKDFVWQGPGVEFCAGLATDGVRLVASYGVSDREAHLAILSPAAVREKLLVLNAT